MEEKPDREPAFKAYHEVKAIADPRCLTYFKKWNEIIQLEQSSTSVHLSSSINNTVEKKYIKDDGLRITRVEEVPGQRNEFFVYLERPYYLTNRQNSEITENSFVNLHTQKNISFTKGIVLKKHLLTKEAPPTAQSEQKKAEEEDDDEDGEETALLDNDTNKV
jgi:hypothetical protein